MCLPGDTSGSPKGYFGLDLPASLLVTSNLAFGEWTRVFGEASLTAALLDRFTHRCYIYEFDWESIRLAESLKRQKKIRRKRAGGVHL